MARQVAEISTNEGVRYQCDHCRDVRQLDYVPSNFGGTDGLARSLGYRLTSSADDAKVYCPECSGVDPEWKRRGRWVA